MTLLINNEYFLFLLFLIVVPFTSWEYVNGYLLYMRYDKLFCFFYFNLACNEEWEEGDWDWDWELFNYTILG